MVCQLQGKIKAFVDTKKHELKSKAAMKTLQFLRFNIKSVNAEKEIQSLTERTIKQRLIILRLTSSGTYLVI